MSRDPYTLRMIILRVTTGAAMKQATARLCHLWIDFALQRSRRKCKIVTNPPKGKRTCRGGATTDPNGVTPAQRLKELPGEALSVSNGRLFYNACREELSLKSSSSHANTKRHNGHKASIMGGVAGHKRGILKESEHSIIGKNLSILCTGLDLATCFLYSRYSLDHDST